jgi:hypothetical protein
VETLRELQSVSQCAHSTQQLQARIINDSFKHPARILQTMQSGVSSQFLPNYCSFPIDALLVDFQNTCGNYKINILHSLSY